MACWAVSRRPGGIRPRAYRRRASTTPTRLYFPETQHTLSGKFLDYWQQNGGLALFGYPISEPVVENGVTVQYFQRNRFELHPDQAGTPYEVQLGLLGRDLLAQRVQVTETTVSLPTYGYEAGLLFSPRTTRSRPTRTSTSPRWGRSLCAATV